MDNVSCKGCRHLDKYRDTDIFGKPRETGLWYCKWKRVAWAGSLLMFCDDREEFNWEPMTEQLDLFESGNKQ